MSDTVKRRLFNAYLRGFRDGVGGLPRPEVDYEVAYTNGWDEGSNVLKYAKLEAERYADAQLRSDEEAMHGDFVNGDAL